MLMRNGKRDTVRLRLMKQLGERVDTVGDSAELLGVEGSAAAQYFGGFGTMLRSTDTVGTFDWASRNKRPPRDPVNAMLSFAYALLAKECSVALLSVGLDPHWGLFHQPRHGRPSLGLDLMEEFRPLIADSAVLTAINTGMVSDRSFVRSAGVCSLDAHGRKALIRAYEARLDQLVTHPMFDYRLSWRRVIFAQARILERVIRGEIAEYCGMVTR